MKYQVYINKFMLTGIDKPEVILTCDSLEQAEQIANEQELDLLAGIEKIPDEK